MLRCESILLILLVGLACGAPETGPPADPVPDPVGDIDFEIVLPSGALTPEPGVDQSIVEGGVQAARARAERGFPERAHALVQLNEPGSVASLEKLAAAGIWMLEPLGGNAWRAAVSPEGFRVLTSLREVRWAAVEQPKHRASLDQVRKILGYQVDRSGNIRFRVRAHADVSFAEIEDLALRLEASLPENAQLEFEMFNGLDLAIPKKNIDALASEDILSKVERASPAPIPYNLNAQGFSNVNTVQAPPYNLSGAGVTVGVWEAVGGRVQNHPDLVGRVTVRDGAPNLTDHATHVAGTVAADGTGNANAEGMAPAATVDSYDAANDDAELRLTGVSLPFLGVLFPAVDASNHSYGLPIGWEPGPLRFLNNQNLFGSYTDNSRRFDEMVRSKGLPVVVAAGNHRNDSDTNGAAVPNGGLQDCLQGGGAAPRDCLGPLATAKNVITVGATNGAGNPAFFSSFGPTDDGRTKPDVMADGASAGGLLSTDLTTTDNDGDGLPENYGTRPGTSMAAPVVTGTIALLHQQADNLGLTLRSSAYKALLVQTATDLLTPGPDIQTGWGRVDAQAAADLLRDPAGPCHRSMRLTSVADTRSFQFCVEPGSVAQATIAWDDLPGATLQQDIDLRLIQPNGTVRSPWVLGAAGTATGTGNDTINNVEQVQVTNAMGGVWTATVTATTLVPRVRLNGLQVVVDSNPQRVDLAGICPLPDQDDDGLADCVDICPAAWDPGQGDLDGDGMGDACDPDDDNDGVDDSTDNCRRLANSGQQDNDGDGVGDACDPDDDNDCVVDRLDNCPTVENCNYYGSAASAFVCDDPCPTDRNFTEDLGRFFHLCISEPVDPQCLVDGCPWPSFQGAGAEKLLRNVAQDWASNPSGFRSLDGNRIVFPPDVSSLPDPDRRLLPQTGGRFPVGGGEIPRPLPDFGALLCDGMIGSLVDRYEDRAEAHRQCVAAQRAEAEACQADADNDGIGDACDR